MSRSPKLQRLTAMAVPALLAANAMVLVLGVAAMDDVIDDAKPAAAGTETVTYIKSADGTLRLVDPTTPEGWKAIADANERGDQVVTVREGEEPDAILRQSATSTTRAPGVTVPDVNALLDDAEATVVDTLGQVGDTVDGVVDSLTDTIDNTAGTNVGDLLDNQVDNGTDTLTTTVSTVVRETRSTATTVVTTATTVVTPPPTTVPQATVPPPVAEVVPSGATEPVAVPGL